MLSFALSAACVRKLARADMLSVLVCVFVALHLYFYRSSAAAYSPGQESSPWFIGCVNASSSSLSFYAPKGARDLDPVTCSVRCLDEGYQVAALSSQACYCGNQLHGLVVSECFNTSPNEGTKDVKGGSERQSALYLPLGNQKEGNMALYRTEGPFLCNISTSTSPDPLQAGETFVVKVSGNLAGRLNQSTGIVGLGGQDLSHVTVEFLGTTSKGQSSLHVSVSDDGSFAVSCHWILNTPGNYKFTVLVSTPLSTLSTTLHLSVLDPSPGSSVSSLRHSPLGVPTCIPFVHLDSYNVTVEAAYQGDPVTLRANLKEERLATEFCCCFKHKEEESCSRCLNSSAAVVRLVVPDLGEGVSGVQLSVSVDVEPFTATRHLLVLGLTQSYGSHGDLSGKEQGCNHGNVTHDDRSRSQSHGNIRWHVAIHSHPCTDTHHPDSSSQSSSCLHVCLHFRSPVFSATDPSPVLPQTSMCDCVCVVRANGNWSSVVSAHEEFSLEVVSCKNCTWSRVVWTISSDDGVVINRTAEDCNINVSLPKAGRYTITAHTYNQSSWVSFQTQISVQDPVGELLLHLPCRVATNQKHLVLFSITAGSDVTVCLPVNETLMHRNSSNTTGAEAASVCSHTGTVMIELRAQNRASSQKGNAKVRVERKRKPSPQAKINPPQQPPTSQSPIQDTSDKAVSIYAAKRAYPTNTDITLMAVADLPDPVAFLWDFGDSRSARTTSRAITRRYHHPGSYDVSVVASHGQTSVTSDVFPLVIQRAVKLNRLVHRASDLQNQTVMVSCRVNVGTNISFLWSFGDGTMRPGQSTEQHIFHRTGAFRVEVTASNLVSSASLSSYIFVVDRPCQPPPVKNMGPLKLQVRRYEVVHLGVTYETEVDCDISGGLRYSWTLLDSAGRTFPLPHTDTYRQSLILQGHLLQYDTYTATARVQVIGSVVYSNYSVRVQVIPSPPVAVIQGGTNVFINKRSGATVTLDGRSSYDPDSPGNPLSYSWTCKPVSSIPAPCFDQHHVPTSAPLLDFPVGFLKHNFDQFQFTLTIHSGERSASSETFLTVTSNPIRKVAVNCPQCQGDHVNWDQSFSVGATCEDCNIPAKYIQYSWSLYLVNASSKPVTDVPFCYTVDLKALSAIMEDPATSAQTPVAKASQHTHAVYASAPSYLTENGSEAEAKKENLDLADSVARSSKSRNTTNKTGVSEPAPSDSGGELYSDYTGQSDSISEFLMDTDSSADWELSFSFLESGDFSGRPDSDYDLPFPSAEEGDPGMSAGRPAGVDGEDVSAGDDSAFDPALHEDEGSNLVDSKPSTLNQEPTLLDLPRMLVDRGLFESYTYTGISSSSLGFRAFSLRSRSAYMLEVTAKSQNSFLGRTQLFFKTNPVPAGMTCQVQPDKGVELHTHFSIFCTSGKEDLLYKFSFSVGDEAPRTLYQGRDFQHYFSLPSGDPSDDYKVTIYTEITNSAYGSSTKPCPVIVQVQPSFLRDASSSSSHHDPGLELSEAGLRNLSVLVQLGNSAEIRNYVSLLSGILNRLSLDTRVNTQAQTHMRNVLICTVCKLESSEQSSAADTVGILEDLLQVTTQVTLASAKRVTAHVQAISEPRIGDQYYANQRIVSSLVGLLSYNLQVATSHNFTPGTHAEVIPDASILNSSTRFHIKQVGAVPTKQIVQLVADILQTASDLMLKYILFHEIQEHRVSTGLLTLHAASQNQTSTVISSGSATFYLPATLMQILFVHRSRDSEGDRPCVLRVLTEITHSPYTWAGSSLTSSADFQLSGLVFDLSLYKCSNRRKISVRSLVQPINVELQHPQRNKSSVHEHILLRSQVNYHSFNISQEHLQQAVQLTVAFTPPPDKPFPVTLLFRMFERPTPSVHHLRKIYQWKGNTTRITLLPFYLNAAGVGHLALFNAEFGKAPRSKRLSEQISYSLTVDSSLCLSWDGQQGAWTHHGCRTQQADAAPSVNCSCHQLSPLTVLRQQIESSHDTESLDPFLSVSTDLTVLGVLMVCVCLYIPVLVVCKRADVASEENQRVHDLPDNSPSDPYLYAVAIHTGLCSVASMSAKVYIVLHGEDRLSQTRELQVPGCSLFRRNSQDTFLLSTADSLGPVWGVHIWHDNSGPSPDWYLKQVEVSEVNRGHVTGGCARLFVARCWLAANRGDGRVERMLRVCTQRMGFAKVLCLKLSDYWSDFHIWISVHSCPRPHSFTQTQRLAVSLLLLLGYACVDAVIISQTDHQLPLELSFVDVSAVSVRAGLLSVLAVLPAAAVVSFLFRLREVKLMGSRTQHTKGRRPENDCSEDALSVNASVSESHLSWSGLQQWAQEAWRKKHQDTDLLSVSTMFLENKDADKAPVIQPGGIIRKDDALAFEMSLEPALQKMFPISKGSNADQAPEGNESDLRAWLSATRDEGQAVQKERVLQGKCSPERGFEEVAHQRAALHKLREQRFSPTSHWCHCLAWALCLCSSLSCLVFCAVLGMRFSSSEVLFWIQSLFFSLMFCIFLIQPAVILTAAVVASCWYKNTPDFHSFFNTKKFDIETSKLWSRDSSSRPGDRFRPSAVPQKSCSYLEKRLEDRQRARYLRLVRPPTPAELRKTRADKRREALIHKTLREMSLCASMVFLMMCITCGNSFGDHYHLNKAVTNQFIRSRDNAFMSIRTHDDWWKWTQTSLLHLLYENVSHKTEAPILIGDPILQKTEVTEVSMVTLLRTSGHVGRFSGQSASISLGRKRTDAASKLKLLHSSGWLGGRTAALKVQFNFYSPAPNLFTSVTLLTEQSPAGVLLPSAKVQSVRVYHTPAVWDYVVMVCQLLFLLLSLLQLRHQVSSVAEQGLMGYWRTPLNWVEVSLLTVTLVYYVHHVYHSVMTTEVAGLLQRHKCRGPIDVSLLASCEQIVRTLRGIILFLLTMKCVTVLRVNRTLATSATLIAHSLSALLWPTISGLMLVLALSCIGNLLYAQSSWAFSSIPRSLQMLLCHRRGFAATSGLHLLSGRDFFYRGVLYLSSTVAWTAVVIAVVSSLIRGVRRSQSRRNVFTVAELAVYVRRRVSEFTGKRRPAWIDNNVQRRTYYLEEFETLVDELLFRLNALSNSLHHTLPPKAHLYREEDSPVVSPTTLHSSTNAQDSEKSQMMVNDPTNVGDRGETSPAPHLLRSQVELEILQVLQQRGQMKHLDAAAASDFILKGTNLLSCPESVSLKRLWAEGVQEKESDKWTETNESCWLSKTRAAHAEVMVEVQVHEEPGRVELNVH